MATDTRRAANISAAEKHLLLDLIQNKYTIIENKETDRFSVAEKSSAWKALADDFCLTQGHQK